MLTSLLTTSSKYQKLKITTYNYSYGTTCII